MVMASRSSVRSFAISVALVAATSALSGCFNQSQPVAPTPIPPVASPVASPAASPVVVPASSPSPAATEDSGQTHTVGEGETLATIAEQYYEDSAQWRKIYDANKDAIGDNPDSIKIGQSLKIPPK
jgi:nucleoid-associated protein YgaU